MGLDIHSRLRNGRYGPYTRIHILRRWLLKNAEGNPQQLINDAYDSFIDKEKSEKAWEKMEIKNFRLLINHSDCDGGYKRYKKKNKATWEWEDVDKLAIELQKIKTEYYDEMPHIVKECFDDFCKYVVKFGENNEIEDIAEYVEFF